MIAIGQRQELQPLPLASPSARSPASPIAGLFHLPAFTRSNLRFTPGRGGEGETRWRRQEVGGSEIGCPDTGEQR